MKFENIKDIPLSINNYSIKKIHYGSDNDFKLLFILKGNIDITINGEKYIVKEKELFLINSGCIYSIEGLRENEICILKIRGDYFNSYYDDFLKMRFNLNFSAYKGDQLEDIYFMWNMLYGIIKALYKGGKECVLRVNDMLLQFAILLVSKYVDINFDDKKNLHIEEDRLTSIIQYININYKEKITLDEIAKEIHLTPQYVSRYFSQNIGITLNEYIYKVRLRESLKDLYDDKNKIIYVALENGFPNLKSYFKVFKDQFNTTPSVYRKKLKNISMEFELVQETNLMSAQEILNFIDNNFNKFPKENRAIQEYEYRNVIDCSKARKKIKKSWSTLVTFSKASDGLKAELRNQLRNIQMDIPFEYVRFHGIFSDDMMVYNEDSSGVPEFNFSYVEELIDFFLEIKLKPFIELSFMPEQLASEKKYMFNWNANVSKPKSIDKWKLLVESLIKYLINRYGIKEVSSWYFEIWTICMPYSKIDKSYMNYFKETYLSIKSVNNKLKVGGVNTIIEEAIDSKILLEYDSFCEKENIVLDFISLKSYAIVLEDKKENISDVIKKANNNSINKIIPQKGADYFVHAEEEYLSKNINEMIKILDKCNIIQKQVFINEWNTSGYPSDILHDTCFKAAYLVKNIINNFEKVEGIGYWTFTDIFEELKVSNVTFHGGLGFITNNGLKKPIYFAYELLNKLGEILVEKGDYFIVTKNKDGAVQILLHNYCHFANDKVKINGDDIKNINIDYIFDNKIRKVSFLLKEIKGQVIKKTYKINRENGSVYDEWIKIGAPETLYLEDKKYLEKKSILGYKKEQLYIEKELEISEKMLPQEVMLIEIIPKE